MVMYIKGIRKSTKDPQRSKNAPFSSLCRGSILFSLLLLLNLFAVFPNLNWTTGSDMMPIVCFPLPQPDF
jgi:hypothetical protein